MQKTRAFLIGLVAVGALAACGSSAKSADTTADDAVATTVPAGELTKASYIAEADAVCASYEAQINAASDSIPVDADASEIAQAERDAILPLQKRELAALQALTAPEQDIPTLNKIWAQADTAMQAETRDFDAVNAELTAYGFTDCAF